MSCVFNINELMTGILRFILSMFTHSDSVAIRGANPPVDGDDGRCELVGTFSLITQACLGLLCLSSLIVKRSYEWPVRRTWIVWFFDVSKQLFGALGVHVFNVMLSIIKSRGDKDGLSRSSVGDGNWDGWDDDSDDDPCNWYFLNIVFDCTIGVYILYLIFTLLNKICMDYLHISNIKSGEYGDSVRPSVKAYLKQLVIYYVSLMLTKVVLFFFMNIFSVQLLWITSHILLGWLDDYPDEIEIFMVMFVIPVFMNCLQLVLVDNIIQNPYFRLHSHDEGDDTDNTITDTDESDALIDNTNKNYGTSEA